MGWPEGLPTLKNYAPEQTHFEFVASFNTPECNGESPPGARAFMITLDPAPTSHKMHEDHKPHALNTKITNGLTAMEEQNSAGAPQLSPHYATYF
ncbi:unnamed protein product [Rodentolepis nana]|uniref:Uncharacterized protein n=1 Tax=Rodentolepis nana TaxID=102285 RepID=A0A0R3TKK8_RODNA|nr:unnamed protein product [Rodentolepis nana]